MSKSKKNNNAPSVEVENTSINAQPATAPIVENIPATEIMPEPIPTEEKDVDIKKFNSTLKDGVKSVPVTTAPEWGSRLPGIVTFESKISDANSSGQTLFCLTVETNTKIYKFINASVSDVNRVFGLEPLQPRAKVKLAVKTNAELSAEVDKICDKAFEFIGKGMDLLNSYGNVNFSKEIHISSKTLYLEDDNGYIICDGSETSVTRYQIMRIMMAAAKVKNEEIRARVQAARDAAAAKEAERAAKKAEKATNAALKEAKAANKARAAAVLDMDEIQKQMFDAMQKKDWTKVAELSALQQAAENENAA